MMGRHFTGTPGELYRPSNGTEGDAFLAAWCCRCGRDKAMREGCGIDECDDGERCDIIADTMIFNIDDPEYPRAWCYGPDGQPMCAAFVEPGTPIPPTAEELEAAGQQRLF